MSTERLDLMRDEFARILALSDNQEIRGICERATMEIEQHEPVIAQRDKAQRQLQAFSVDQIIKPGCGFWNVTKLPKGGDFKRSVKGVPFRVELIAEKYEDGSPKEYCGVTTEGMRVCVGAVNCSPKHDNRDDCYECGGKGMTDSGAITPHGGFYEQSCHSCEGTGLASVALLIWARSLLGQSTRNEAVPGFTLPLYAEQFGKWWAQSHNFIEARTHPKP